MSKQFFELKHGGVMLHPLGILSMSLKEFSTPDWLPSQYVLQLRHESGRAVQLVISAQAVGTELGIVENAVDRVVWQMAKQLNDDWKQDL